MKILCSENQVPGAPQSLRPQADSTSIAITWEPPLDDGIMVRGYVVGWGVGIPDLNSKRLGSNQRYFKIESWFFIKNIFLYFL